MDAIAGLSEINSGHQQYPQNPQPVGNAISVENLKSIDTSSTGYGPVNPPRPTPGPTGSDKFRPPSTFLYGFKPYFGLLARYSLMLFLFALTPELQTCLLQFVAIRFQQ